MKRVVELLTGFVAWRWAPAVWLLVSSMVYVLAVVVLVPSEIGVRGRNAKPSAQGGAVTTGASTPAGDDARQTLATSQSPPSPAPLSDARRAPNDFGRRGFSPRRDRPEPPPPSPALPPPPLSGPAAGASAALGRTSEQAVAALDDSPESTIAPSAPALSTVNPLAAPAEP